MRSLTIRDPQLIEYLNDVSDEDIELLLLSIFTLRGSTSRRDPIDNLQANIEELSRSVRGTTEFHQGEIQRLHDIVALNHDRLDNTIRQNLLDIQEKGIMVKQTELPEGLIAPILGALTETRNWIMDSTQIFQKQDKVVVDVLHEKMSKIDNLATSMERIAVDLERMVGRTQGSRKGVLLEDLVVDYLFENMKECTVERISSNKQKGRMDLCVSRVDMPDIAIDLKNGSKAKNLSSSDLEKFYRDMTTGGKHAILAVFNGCITGKRKFHIEIHGKNICVILHSLEIGTDYAQIMMAINVIWVLGAQLTNQDKVDGILFGHTQMIEIQQNIDAFSDLLKSQRTHLDLAVKHNSDMARNRMMLASLLKQKETT